MNVGKALPLARYVVAVLAVGGLGGGFAIAFRAALGAALRLAFHEPDILSSFRALPVGWRVLVPATGGLVAGLLGMIAARPARGRGERGRTEPDRS